MLGALALTVGLAACAAPAPASECPPDDHQEGWDAPLPFVTLEQVEESLVLPMPVPAGGCAYDQSAPFGQSELSSFRINYWDMEDQDESDWLAIAEQLGLATKAEEDDGGFSAVGNLTDGREVEIDLSSQVIDATTLQLMTDFGYQVEIGQHVGSVAVRTDG
jgi:hypothetical protein